MQLWDEVKYQTKRVQPQSFWDVIGNWLSTEFGDIYRDKNKLISCYSSERVHQYDEDEFPQVIYDYIDEFSKEHKPSSPFIIYGPPGIGKTTYIANLIKVKIPADYSINLFPIIFDLRNITNFDNMAEDFYSKLNSSYRNNDFINRIFYSISPDDKLRIYIKLFHDLLNEDIIDFSPTNTDVIFEDEATKKNVKDCIESRYLPKKDLLLSRKTTYLAEKHDIQIVFVLDNFDHLHEHERVHQAVYSLSREILSKFGRPVFLPMRNYTLKDSYNLYGYVEADKPRNKSLSPPIHKSVLLKRKDHIFDAMGKKVILTDNKSIGKERLINSVNIILNGIYGNDQILNFLEGIAGDNLRTYLDLLILSLQSGHLQYTEIQPGFSTISYKSFVRACIYCNHLIFRPGDRRCPVINLFDNREPMGSRNTIIRIRLLQRLNYSDAPEKVENLLIDFQELGYLEDNVFKGLKTFVNAGLVDEAPYYQVGVPMSKERYFSISKVGKYYIEKLLYDAAFFEAMASSLNLPRSYKPNMENILTYSDESKRCREIRYNSLMRIISYINECEREEEEIIKTSKSINPEPYIIVSSFLRSSIIETYSEIS